MSNSLAFLQKYLIITSQQEIAGYVFYGEYILPIRPLIAISRGVFFTFDMGIMADNQGSKKICVYIDGFNMFHTIKKIFGKKYYWLNYKELARKYVGHNEKLVQVYYFTAYYHRDKDGVLRHKEYIGALNMHGVKTILGKYQEVWRNFTNLGDNIVSTIPEKYNRKQLPNKVVYKNFEEKRTDVNMATQIVSDGLLDCYDKAIIITGDSDISPAIEAVKKFRKDKIFVSVIPIGGDGFTMRQVCHKVIDMTEQHLIDSQFPNVIGKYKKPVDRE